MAFGSILSGLDTATLKPLVEQAMPTLIELMYDSSVMVSVLIPVFNPRSESHHCR